jgi:hypothetical protein
MEVPPKDLRSIPREHRERLEEMGEALVRVMVSIGQIPPSLTASSVWWIAELDEAARKRSEAQRGKDEAFQVEQTWLGKIAAYGSVGAVVIGVIGICVMIILWRFPRH